MFRLYLSAKLKFSYRPSLQGAENENYGSNSTILPPLQRPRSLQTTNTAAARGYFDQSSQELVLASPVSQGDRYAGSVS